MKLESLPKYLRHEVAAARAADAAGVVGDFIRSLTGVPQSQEVLPHLDRVRRCLADREDVQQLGQAMAALDAALVGSRFRACEPGVLGQLQELYRTSYRPFRYVAVVMPERPEMAQATLMLLRRAYRLSRSYEYPDLIVRDLAHLDAVRIVADRAASDALLAVGCPASRLTCLDSDGAAGLLDWDW